MKNSVVTYSVTEFERCAAAMMQRYFARHGFAAASVTSVEWNRMTRGVKGIAGPVTIDLVSGDPPGAIDLSLVVHDRITKEDVKLGLSTLMGALDPQAKTPHCIQALDMSTVPGAIERAFNIIDGVVPTAFDGRVPDYAEIVSRACCAFDIVARRRGYYP